MKEGNRSSDDLVSSKNTYYNISLCSSFISNSKKKEIKLDMKGSIDKILLLP